MPEIIQFIIRAVLPYMGIAGMIASVALQISGYKNPQLAKILFGISALVLLVPLIISCPWRQIGQIAVEHRLLSIIGISLTGMLLFGGAAIVFLPSKTTNPNTDNVGNLEVQALLFDDPYPDNTDFAGIRWLSIDSDVRVNFINRAPVPLQNLEFVVSFDNAQIKAVGNLDNYPGISVVRSNSSGPDALWLTTSENTAIPAQMVFADSYRIRCEKVFDRSTIHFSIAVFCVGRPPGDTSSDPLPKKLVRRRPLVIHIKGNYEIPSKRGMEMHPVDFSHAFPASMSPDAAAVAATLPRPPSSIPNKEASPH